jgi:magnesium transporter
MDAIVDFYFQVLEQIGEDIENVEQEVVDRPQATTLKSVHMLKRELIFLRRSVWPIRSCYRRDAHFSARSLRSRHTHDRYDRDSKGHRIRDA